MASGARFLLPQIFLTLILAETMFSTVARTMGSNNSTIYDELQVKGLPKGLLPKGISKYWINSTSGEFAVFLEQPCNAKFENEVHYDSNVTGTLAYGRIAKLSGVSAQELFLWFPVKGIRVDVPSSGVIHFDVGVADKQFSLSLFESPRDCTAAATDPSEQVHSEMLQNLETANGENEHVLQADS